MTLQLATSYTVVTCYRADCAVTFALQQRHQRELRNSHATFYCPRGHGQAYTAAASDAAKLEAATARETALKDQLAAAVRDGEATRAALVRDRHRFANGVCPCCTRTFDNVRRHMATKHPDYDIDKVRTPETKARCSCGRSFATPHGLAVHQGRARSGNWDRPNTSKYSAHLTEVSAR